MFDENSIELIKEKYNMSLDADFLGSNYEVIKKAYEDNLSKEEFENLIDSLTF